MIRLVVLALLAGCPGPPPRQPSGPSEPEVAAEDAATRLERLRGQLRDDILSSYERDEPPERDSGMIDPRIGTARIGAGPEDVYVANDLARAPSRWPLDVDSSTRTDVRSKRLDIHIAADETAAWMADEVSWRIEMCGRTAVIPLRITTLYAHDGDRWVPVFEHLSFGWTPTPSDVKPRKITTAVFTGELRDDLSRVLDQGPFRKAGAAKATSGPSAAGTSSAPSAALPPDPQVMAQDASALVLGPGVDDEWRATQVLHDSQLPAGTREERRVGLVGRDPEAATIAYWIGSYTADLPARPGVAAGKARMRVTHVFEKRRPPPPGPPRERGGGLVESCAEDKDRKDRNADCRWQHVQTHMSQPIDDEPLGKQVFGNALSSSKPLKLSCADEPTAPAAAPRRASEPAARTP
jgi:hypothetical protein